MVRQRLGPHWIPSEWGRLSSSGGWHNGSPTKHGGADREHGDQQQKTRANVETTLHDFASSILVIVHDWDTEEQAALRYTGYSSGHARQNCISDLASRPAAQRRCTRDPHLRNASAFP